MSNNENLYIEVFMTSDDNRRLKIEINHIINIDKLDVFVKAINKAKDTCTNLNPLVQYLKNKEINFLHKNGWSIDDIDFFIIKDQALEYFENKKENGGTFLDAHQNWWPHVPVNAIGKVFYELHLDGVVIPSRNVGDSGGYVLKKYYQENQNKNHTSFRDYLSDDDKSKSTKTLVTSNPKPKITITKKQGKEIRADVIQTAACNDICEAGFKPEFINKLPDTHQCYIDNLSNLQIKIMRTEVAKKCKS